MERPRRFEVHPSMPACRVRRGNLAILTLAVLVTAGVSGLSACGSDDDHDASDERLDHPTGPEAPTSAATSNAHLPAEVDAAIQAAQAGEPRALVDLLRRPHAEVREQLGPHRIEASTTFHLEPSKAPPALPSEDARFSPARTVHDTLDLVWLPSDDVDQPTFSLHQHNDHDRGRDVVAIDGLIYTRLPHRPWISRPLDTEVHERWLDDAFRSVGDVLELAGPRLAVSRGKARDQAGQRGEVLQLTLAAEPVPFDLPAHARAGWRANAEITGVSGELVIDAQTGAWLNADLEVRYEVDADYTPRTRLRGQISVRAGLAPKSEGLAVEAPHQSEPYPERRRLELERDELLDGLATP